MTGTCVHTHLSDGLSVICQRCLSVRGITHTYFRGCVSLVGIEGGSFKAFSLVKALRHLGMQTVVVGSQTGSKEDYEYLKEITDAGTIIVDVGRMRGSVQLVLCVLWSM